MTLDHNRVPDITDVRAAEKRIRDAVIGTPLLESPLLNALAGKRILVKAECLQITGAFKLRGAWAAVSALDSSQRANGLLAYSSGNHAQAVAYASAKHDCKATIIMPNDAPLLKRSNTAAYGAEVVLYDRPGGEDRDAIGRQLAEERGCFLIKPYDNTQVIAGQGTCGLELARQLKGLHVSQAEVLVCCGGGGLSSGIALALEADAPFTRVRTVEPHHYDDVARSLRSGKRESVHTSETTICDAIVTPSPGELTFPILQRLCGPGMAVSDSEVLQAMAAALTHLKLVAEPGGAVSLAAALFHSEEIESDTVVCVVSGGNADFQTIARALASQI